jgi:SulP family sulfate permease
VGSTFLRVLSRYNTNLKTCRGKLVLVGVSEPVYQQLQNTEMLDQFGRENVYKATSIFGDSSRKGYDDAVEWLKQTGMEKYS